MKAVIPAAGEGTRLRPLTDEKPKPLVEVRGTPILTYRLEAVTRRDVEEIVIVVGYRGRKIVERYGGTFNGVPISYVRQREREGLAHAVLQAEEHVDDDFVLLDGDTIQAGGLDESIRAYRADGVDGTILLNEVSAAAASRKAVCETDERQFVTAITNKPADPPAPSFVAAGCHIFPAAIVDACKSVRKSPRGEYELSDAIDRLLREGYAIRGVTCDGPVVNINTTADLETAERYVRTGRFRDPA